MSLIKNTLASLLRRLKLLKPEAVRYNDLKVYTMVNSITLSTDMNTLFLIDNGRALAFPLQKEKMVLVGLMKGQITVATSLDPSEMTDLPEPGPENPEDPSTGTLLRGSGGGSGSGGGGEEIKVPVTADAQWTLIFNRKYQVMGLIGATEINPGLTPDEPEPIDPSVFIFNLNEVVVGIRRMGNALVLTPLRRREKIPAS
ncbi:MAG: hypothetical protein KDD19_13670 [Phaeodactylibacter sp.]|nr:hypothetical protein [Phaeodactylibacter sp.]MCB9054075.1 hypothetical protein [Lewinellaceae bacterium]